MVGIDIFIILHVYMHAIVRGNNVGLMFSGEIMQVLFIYDYVYF